MTKKTNATTPLQAARAYAEAHPEFEGKIEVDVLRPKGKGGWGVMRQAVTAWVAGGKAVLSKSQRLDLLIWVRNGHCAACGRVWLEPALATVYRADERAGQPLGLENADERDWFRRQWGANLSFLEESKREPVYAPYCRLSDVCVTCAAALGMELEPRAPWDRRESNEIVCEPAGFVPKPAPAVVRIDLTKKSETAASE